MARVRSTGALATLLRPEELGGGDPGTVNLSLRLFAVLDIGASVVSPGAASTVAPDLKRLRSLDDVEAISLVGFRLGQLPTDHRQAIWSGLVDELAKFDVQTDPETLQALPFELVPTREVRELFD